MTRIEVIAAAALLAMVAACDQGGTSTEDVKEAAAERAREQLALPADMPLETTVWTGEPYNGELTVCGTVSSAAAGTQQIRPQRFIATTDPLAWQVFEDAQSSIIPSQPGKWPEWSKICGSKGAA
jgi:hypothetical protein